MAVRPLRLEIDRVEPAGMTTVREVMALAAAELTRLHGPGHWSKTVTLATLKRRAACKLVFGVRHGEVLVATFTVSDRRIGFYRTAWFADPSAAALYLTEMAVLPDYQGRGIGRWCLRQADRTARSEEATAIRLDAYSGPAGAGGFYRSCGYDFVRVGPHNLEIYERVLSTS